MGLAGAERAVDVIACPGADSCQLALTSSMGVGAAIIDRFEKDLPEFEDLNGLRVRIGAALPASFRRADQRGNVEPGAFAAIETPRGEQR